MIGPKRPLPRQHLVAGLVLYADDGETEMGVILEVSQATVVVLEDVGDGRDQHIYFDHEPVPIVADQIPDPPPEPSELIVPVDAEVEVEDPPA